MELIRIVLADDHWLMPDETHRILEQSADLRVVGHAHRCLRDSGVEAVFFVNSGDSSLD